MKTIRCLKTFENGELELRFDYGTYKTNHDKTYLQSLELASLKDFEKFLTSEVPYKIDDYVNHGDVIKFSDGTYQGKFELIKID